ncbi:hypothetical protein Prudu_271S000200 [Prunus dulcis]|uniref:MULE transposase domain-containing protein n=1 Tax=Prunus dulcis TaxID=3755 RepID=A0A5H2XIE0_PRUDU|nr:hypothetical protein Prudu_271S000200 [Prunus dulcis]
MTDATSRRAYGFYGDVVVFDTTFNMNRYDLTFAPMLGVNNHGHTIVLACAFLSKETTESFIWMFEEFKKVMLGGEPKTIITDQDKAIWDTDNKDEFDAKWNIVVTKAAYARQFFAAGMSSNQRAEGSHDFFKQYISRRNSLMDFIIRFERALSHQCQKELVADHRWKKTAKSGLVSDANGNEIKDSADPGLLTKRSTMSRLASDMVEDALMSKEGCELLSETLKRLQVKLKLLKDGPSNNKVGGSSSQTQYMKDPKRVRCKGRSKRVTGAKEKAMKRGIRYCRETSPSNNDESTPIDRSDPLFDEFDRMHGPTE